jgi:CheY-like chemotaxis protein
MKLTRETLRIVLVENDEDDLFFVRRALQQAGFTYPLVHLRNGRAAVNYLSSLGDPPTWPHVILSDLKMPDMDGIDLLTWLRGQPRFNELPVIMLTSSDDPGDMRQSTQLNVYKFLTKEVHHDNVVSELDLFLHLQNSAEDGTGPET